MGLVIVTLETLASSVKIRAKSKKTLKPLLNLAKSFLILVFTDSNGGSPLNSPQTLFFVLTAFEESRY